MINFNLTTQVRFGIGEAEKWISSLEDKACLIYSKSALPIGLGIPAHFNAHAVSGEPDVATVNRILHSLKNFPALVVGLGGGSAMDAAKAVAACLEKDTQDCSTLLSNSFSETRRKVRLALLPTTSGTGSELSRAAIIYDPASGQKKAIRGDLVLANFAIIDPSLTLSCPTSVTVESGFDCFAHGVETFISRKATPLTRRLSAFIISSTLKNLPKILKDERDEEPRSEMSLASAMAGFNLAQASTCLPHRIQYAFDPAWNMSHGLGLATIYPFWLRTAHANSTARSDLESALGVTDLLETMMKFMDEIGIQEAIRAKLSSITFKISSQAVVGALTDDPGYSPEVLSKIAGDMNKSLSRS